MDNTQDIRILSLCAGYEGIELGLSRALANPLRVVAVEIEAYALANLVAKTEEGKLAIEALWPDLKTFPAERFRGCFDIVTAGYPCQPFSCAGKRQGESDPRHLWPYIARIVQAVRPIWCFFENVSGHLTIGFPTVYRSLRDMGYSVEAGLFTAAECDISMEEGTRLFILAQTTGVNRCILLQPRQSQQACPDTGRPGEILGEANRPGLQGLRPAKSGGGNEFAPTSYAMAPQGIYQEPWEKKRYLESGMGRTTHGTSSRVDRLRLLGNGVVPQQAKEAFGNLMRIINER